MSALPVTVRVPLTMTSPRKVTLPWMSRLPFTIITPQPSTLPLFFTWLLPPSPNCVTVHCGGLAYGFPKAQLQLLLICVHGQLVTLMLLIIASIWATLGPEGDVATLGTIGGPVW